MDNMTLLQAIAFARSRGVLLPADYYALDLNSRQYASTVSYLAGLDQIQSVLDSAYKVLESGGTFRDFQKLVEENGIELSEAHLDNVFRTNIQNAYAHGRWLHQQQNKDKRPYLEYFAINDKRTRPSHLALDGVIRHIDDPFWQKYYPPNGFRCFLPGTQIQGDLHGAIVRTYQGIAVELTTNSNRRLSVTGNHPILTERGWVRADCLNVGDNVISYGLPVNGIDVNNGSIQVNNDDAIPTVENLFDAFISKAFRFSGSSTLKFYSDIANGEIDIDVDDDRLLLNVASDVLQSVEQVEFIRGYDGRFIIQTFESVSTSNLEATINDIVFAENTTDITTGAIKSFCKLSLASVGCGIELDNFSFEFCITGSNGFPSLTELSLNTTRVLFDSLPLDRFGLALSSQDDAMFRELSTNGFSSELGLFRYLVDTHSSQVFIDPVVDIRKFDFSGHVYDFQSSEGILSSDGIISHNCRCTINAITEKQAIRKGITSNEDLPNVEPDAGWAFQPSNYDKQPNEILKSKEASKTITPEAKTEVIDLRKKTVVDTEADQIIKTSLSDLTDEKQVIIDEMVDKAVRLDPNIRPSDLRITLDLADEKENALTTILKQSELQKNQDGTAGKSIWDKVVGAFNRLFTLAKNTASKLTGNSIRGIDDLNLTEGSVIGIQTPTLFKQAQKVGKQIIILDAKGVALDLSKISGMNGALLAPDLNLEVVSNTDEQLVLKRTKEQATRYFVANQTAFSLY